MKIPNQTKQNKTKQQKTLVCCQDNFEMDVSPFEEIALDKGNKKNSRGHQQVRDPLTPHLD